MAAASAAALPPAPGQSGPDLSSLTSTAKGWESGQSPSPAATMNGIGFANGRTPKRATGTYPAVPDGAPPALLGSDSMAPIQAPSMEGPLAAAASGQQRAMPELFDPMASLSQGIADGTTVEVGTSVALVVSSGPPPVTVLNVVGQTQAAATAALTGQGLTVSVTFAPSTTVAGGLVISQTPTGGSTAARGSNVALVISQGTAPTIASFVTRNNTTPNTTITSPGFAVAANTLLVAFISTDGNATGTNIVVNGVNNNNSAPALTWTRAQRANTQRGTSEIWYAFSPTARASITVVGVLSQSQVAQMTVVGFTGAQNTLAGAATAITSKATGVAGDPSLTLTTTKPNSWIFGVGNDWDNRKVVTANAGSTIIAQSPTAITDTFWTVRTTTPQPQSGVTATIGVAGLGTDRYNFAAIEIRQP